MWSASIAPASFDSVIMQLRLRYFTERPKLRDTTLHLNGIKQRYFQQQQTG